MQCLPKFFHPVGQFQRKKVHLKLPFHSHSHLECKGCGDVWSLFFLVIIAVLNTLTCMQFPFASLNACRIRLCLYVHSGDNVIPVAFLKNLLKGRDDLRQDAVMQQVFQMCNTLLQQDADTRKRKLTIRRYKASFAWKFSAVDIMLMP